MAAAIVVLPMPISPMQSRSVPPAIASMPKAMVAAQSRSDSAGLLGDVAGRKVERQIEDLQAEIIGCADLVDRRAASREILHHLLGHLQAERA